MKKANRILSALLCLVLLLGVLPVSALAEDAAPTVDDGKAFMNGSTYNTVFDAVQAASAEGMNTIYLGSGTYTLYDDFGKNSSSTNQYTTGKSFTFIGAGKGETTWMIGAPVPDPAKLGTEYNADYSFGSCTKVVFQNMTLSSYYENNDRKDSNYLGFAHTIVTEVNDCVINGLTCYWGYTSAKFTNTTFNCPDGDYALWTYSSPEMTFDNCEFNSTGKVINVYRDYGAAHYTINFNNCTVKNTGAALKQVLNINDSYPTGQTYTININGSNAVYGLNPDSITCSRLFGFGGKTGNNAGNTVVKFGDTIVWENGAMVDADAYHKSGVTAEGVSYTNDVEDSNNSLYAEGYKDGKITILSATDWVKDSSGAETRTVTKQCEYCGHEWTEVETKEKEETPSTIVGGILASGWLNMEDHYSYIVGYPDGTVQPNGKITRAEVATIFFRLLSDDTREAFWSSTNDYSDVPADKWYNNAVSTLSRLGVISGYPDGTFRPDASITRAEFAKIAVSFCKYGSAAYSGCFSDVKASDWFSTCVETARNSNLIAGYPDGTFRPNSAITRAEACTIVNRTLGRKPAKNHMAISGRINWPDCLDTEWFYADMMEATNSHDYQMVGLVEDWNRKLPQRDWAALETEWSHAYSAPGGEVGR